jgi:energy-coupling factor transporter ATP-binding protein EcfA2
MNRAIKVLLILVVGFLVLWESISWGTRTWVKYGLMKEPLPSITTFLPTSMIQPLIALILVSVLTFVTISAILRSRKLFGIIPPTELARHAIFLGPTGSGKTSAAKTIIGILLRSTKPTVKVTILDWKGEYRSLTDATVIRRINVWDVGGRNPAERAVIAVELLREVTRDVADISPASAALLLKELVKLYERGTPTTKDVVERIEAFLHAAMAERRLAEANMAAALLRRLYWLQIDEERPDENVYRNSDVTIYDMSATGSNYLKTLYSLTVLTKKYYEALRRGTTDQLVEVIVAEECQNYVRGRRFDDPPSIGERVVYELRGFGVGVILVCPDPELLPQGILKDVGVVVSMSPDTLPRFALERFLFRASLEEAEETLKKLKNSRLIVYCKNRLHFFRRLPKPPKELKLKARPKGDRWGLPTRGRGRCEHGQPSHRSPGILAPKIIEVKEEAEEKPKVIEVKVVEERTEVESKTVEAEKPRVAEEPLRLEEEELEEEPEVIEVKEPELTENGAEKATEVKEEKVIEEEESAVEESAVEVEEEIEEKLTEEVLIEEPELAPKGPPILNALPYRVKPAALLSRAHRHVRMGFSFRRGQKWWVAQLSGRVGTESP